MSDIASTYRLWLDCISQGKWDALSKHMNPTYSYNGKDFIPQDFAEFVKKEAARFAAYTITVDIILTDDDAQCLACRLYSQGIPTEAMFGCDPTGQPVYFVEHHLVWFTNGKIAKTLYTLDIPSVRRQLQHPGQVYTVELVGDASQPGSKTLSKEELGDAARAFFDCINDRTMASKMANVCHQELAHNGRKLSLEVYKGLVEKGIASIPDVQLHVQNVVADQDTQLVFVRLEQHDTPTKDLTGLAPNGSAPSFVEHSIYQFDNGKISKMWPVVDWGGGTEAGGGGPVESSVSR